MKKLLFASVFALGAVFFMACSKEDTTNTTTSEVSAQAANATTNNGLTAEDRSGYCKITINYNNEGPCGPGEFNVVLWAFQISGPPKRYQLSNAGILDPNGGWINFPDPASGTTTIVMPMANSTLPIVINGDINNPRLSGARPWVNGGASLDLEFTASNMGAPYHIDGAPWDCSGPNYNAGTAYGNNEERRVALCTFQ